MEQLLAELQGAVRYKGVIKSYYGRKLNHVGKNNDLR